MCAVASVFPAHNVPPVMCAKGQWAALCVSREFDRRRSDLRFLQEKNAAFAGTHSIKTTLHSLLQRQSQPECCLLRPADKQCTCKSITPHQKCRACAKLPHLLLVCSGSHQHPVRPLLLYTPLHSSTAALKPQQPSLPLPSATSETAAVVLQYVPRTSNNSPHHQTARCQSRMQSVPGLRREQAAVHLAGGAGNRWQTTTLHQHQHHLRLRLKRHHLRLSMAPNQHHHQHQQQLPNLNSSLSLQLRHLFSSSNRLSPSSSRPQQANCRLKVRSGTSTHRLAASLLNNSNRNRNSRSSSSNRRAARRAKSNGHRYVSTCLGRLDGSHSVSCCF